MNLEINVKNIGKLADAKVHIGNFTVLAGPNSTGKSFVSKMLYSLFNAMNANHAELHVGNLINPVVSEFYDLARWRRPSAKKTQLSSLENKIEVLESIVGDCSISNSEQFEDIKLKALSQVEEIRASLGKIGGLEDEAKRGTLFDNSLESRAELSPNRLSQSLDELKVALGQTNYQVCVNAGIEYKIRQNLIHNFQIPNLSHLRSEAETPSELEIEGGGRFELLNDEVKFDVDPVLLRDLQRHSNVIYLESPVYWKLKPALEDVRHSLRYFRRGRRETLNGVPEYFYDLQSALRFPGTGKIAFPELYEKLTGNDVLGGKIAVSDSGDLSFQENGRDFSLPVTAMGIVNLGILALLIERNLLDKDAFLFIDEPEAHLHPSWQIVMAETLFELSRHGTNVVIATHSVDILKWLEVHIKKFPNERELVALNRFPVGSTRVDEDFETKLASIKQELTKPFSDLYLEGV